MNNFKFGKDEAVEEAKTRTSDVFDENEIANMLATYLRNEPNNKPYLIPSNVIQVLIRQVTNCRNDVHALEGFGCILTVCMRYATTPTVNEPSLIASVCFLQSIVTECIVLMKLMNSSIELVNPSDVLDITDFESIGMFETFFQSLQLAKDILRDSIHQIRSCKEPEKKGDHERRNEHKTQHPIDCFQPHSVYFMAAFALAHIAVVLNATHHINAVPGIVETLVRSINYFIIVTNRLSH